MKKSVWYLLLSFLVFTACKSSAPIADTPVVSIHEEQESAPQSLSVSQEVYDSTLAEVRLFIDKLNVIIYNKDYAGWKNVLSDEFFTRVSSPEFLAKASESNLLRSKKIILKTWEDYFLYVVVPARSNSRVDEIEFTAINAVKVYYLEKSSKNNAEATDIRRLRLYELIKKTGDSWKIID